MYLHISHFVHSDTILPCADEVMRNRNAESAGFPGRKRQHKADGGASVDTVDENIVQGIDVGEDVLPGERFNQHGRVHCASLG